MKKDFHHLLDLSVDNRQKIQMCFDVLWHKFSMTSINDDVYIFGNQIAVLVVNYGICNTIVLEIP